MGRTLKEVSTLKQMLQFGRPNKQTKLVFGFWILSKGDIIGNRVLWPKLALESERAPFSKEVFWEFLATMAGPKIEISRHFVFPR